MYTVGNTGFTPDPLNVNVGDTVVFMNSGGFHNVNFANHPSLGTSGNPVGVQVILELSFLILQANTIINVTRMFPWECLEQLRLTLIQQLKIFG